MKPLLLYFLTVCSLLSCELAAQTPTPAFPTAEGFGKWATGGRGGQVVEVTRLDDDELGNLEGSLRWALKQHSGQPLTIVFRTSGTIDLNGHDLRSKRSNLTIAGQTAPGDGICIKGGNVNLGGSYNVIVRFLRMRVGLRNGTDFIPGASLSLENGGNFIIDHCSFSWSAEENTGFYDNTHSTVQWCIASEGLYNAGHGKGARSYGSVWGGRKATYHHNLLAHNVSRSPRFGTSTKNDRHMLVDYVNNVNYNYGRQNACYGGENELGAAGSVHINLVNNYYKPGPAYPGERRSNLVRASYEVGAQHHYFSHWHLSGNYIEGEANASINEDNYLGLEIEEYVEHLPSTTIDSLKVDHIAVEEPVSTQTAHEAYAQVLEQVGAFPRDSVDRRLIEEVRTGTAVASSSFNAYRVTGIIDKPSDAGGYPVLHTYHVVNDTDHDGIADYWERANGLDATDAEDRNRRSTEGYTYLEVYLNGLAGEYLDGFVYPLIDTVVTNSPTPFHDPALHISAYLDQSGHRMVVKSQARVQTITLFDELGRRVKHVTAPALTSVNLMDVPSGWYVVQFETDTHSIQRMRLVK
ncbi:pectate lyase [Catalinimonas alkaloidigena]|uniref:Pectate lyase n=1 Tax=Catalinimonas alkaloidigena TaxID=1075417 RepID=A0A1G9TF78_9BACT|nr:T9SS type A sorting domain-containing protein [Catalinimonas alkaloidigena]SDM46376.1 pectate lyase [Catalinimonas alkaloidigena]